MSSELKIQSFIYNPISVNTFVLYDATNEAVIIDPGMLSSQEKEQLQAFIRDQQLTVKAIVNTHPHIDHTIGNGFSKSTFAAPLLLHEDGMIVYNRNIAYGAAFGLDCDESSFPQPDRYIKDGDEIRFGEQKLRVMETPGHTKGSVSLYAEEAGCLFVGDLIFAGGGYGRTDLPTGDLNELQESIGKVLSLPTEVIIYSGHGPSSTIGKEKSLCAI